MAAWAAGWSCVSRVASRSWILTSRMPEWRATRFRCICTSPRGSQFFASPQSPCWNGCELRAGFTKTSLRYLMTQSSDPGIKTEAAVRGMLEEQNIFLNTYLPGLYNMALCPKCGGGQRRARSLAVNISPDGAFAMWNCLRGACGWNGRIGVKDASPASCRSYTKKEQQVPRESFEAESVVTEFAESTLHLMTLSDEIVKYFAQREISRETLNRNGVRQVSPRSRKGLAIAFPYRKDGRIVNCKYRTLDKLFWQVKYRTLDKLFWQEKNAQKVLYGLDDIKGSSDIIIVEGEMDKLSMEEAGFLNCVSVPDGAPAKVSEKSPPPESEDRKYEYLWNCKDYFEKASRIILATDSDPPGQALAEELARRLGRERCWRVTWPQAGSKICKDANEVLQTLGKQALRNMIETSELYPIRGLFQFSDFFKELDDYYCLRVGDELGLSTGWHGLDTIYRVVPGEMTLVTGVPNSGKSEWIDALLCNLNQSKGWTFGLCSMENKVREHARKLLEKHLKKPFFDAPYAKSMPRITREELEQGKQWLNNNFFLIRCDDDELPSIDWVLKLAKAAVMRHGIRGLVVDPYNELDHQRSPSQTETEYVSLILTRMKRFAQHHDCHVWFVAHPRQLQGWRGDAPNLYDISGSAHFINKCDNGVVIHRNRDPSMGPMDRVQVLVRKVRNKAAGTMGDAFLTYDRITGEFRDYEDFMGR